MEDIVRHKLAELVGRFGLDLCSDPKRCEGLLRDMCGEYKREILALVSAAREGVGTELRKSSAGVPKELIVARLAKRLHDDAGLAEDLSRWAVESWAVALGVASAKEFRFPFKCPHCMAQDNIATKLAGQKTRCPKCNTSLFIANNGREVFLAPVSEALLDAIVPPPTEPEVESIFGTDSQPTGEDPQTAYLAQTVIPVLTQKQGLGKSCQGQAMASLIFSLLGLIVSFVPVLITLTLFLSFFGIFMAIKATNGMKQSRNEAGQGTAIAGFVMGILAIIVAVCCAVVLGSR